MKSLLAVAAAAVILSVTGANGRSLLDDTDKLKGQLVLEVGDLTQLRCPIDGKYDCLTWPRSLYRLGYDVCLDVGGFYGGYTDTGLLVKDSYGTITLFVISSMSMGGDMKQYTVMLYDCPSLY